MNNEEMGNMRSVAPSMLAVAADLCVMGIGKDARNAQQGFNFRGIDSVMNAISPLLVKHSLLIIPNIESREVSEKASKNGGVLFYTVLRVSYSIVNVLDGSSVRVGPFYGEAMDSADKSTNKAMSVAYKYMIFQTFCVPVQGMDDPDNDSPEPRAMIDRETGEVRRVTPEDIKAIVGGLGVTAKHLTQRYGSPQKANLDDLKKFSDQVGDFDAGGKNADQWFSEPL